MLYQIIAKKNEGDKVGNVREPLGTVTPACQLGFKNPSFIHVYYRGIALFPSAFERTSCTRILQYHHWMVESKFWGIHKGIYLWLGLKPPPIGEKRVHVHSLHRRSTETRHQLKFSLYELCSTLPHSPISTSWQVRSRKDPKRWCIKVKRDTNRISNFLWLLYHCPSLLNFLEQITQ